MTLLHLTASHLTPVNTTILKFHSTLLPSLQCKTNVKPMKCLHEECILHLITLRSFEVTLYFVLIVRLSQHNQHHQDNSHFKSVAPQLRRRVCPCFIVFQCRMKRVMISISPHLLSPVSCLILLNINQSFNPLSLPCHT